jgi:hypothetical protein
VREGSIFRRCTRCKEPTVHRWLQRCRDMGPAAGSAARVRPGYILTVRDLASLHAVLRNYARHRGTPTRSGSNFGPFLVAGAITTDSTSALITARR